MSKMPCSVPPEFIYSLLTLTVYFVIQYVFAHCVRTLFVKVNAPEIRAPTNMIRRQEGTRKSIWELQPHFPEGWDTECKGTRPEDKDL